MEKYNDPSIPLQTTAVTAVDTQEPLIWVEYRGPYDYATITTTATVGDITLLADDVSTPTTDFNLYQPGEVVTSHTNAAINLSDAAWSTWGEVLDEINMYNCDGWYAWPGCALRADLTEASAGALVGLAAAATSCWRKPIAIYHDTSALMSAVSGGEYVIGAGLSNKEDVFGSDEGRIIELYNLSMLTTGTKTANKVRIYTVNNLAKTETLIFQIAAGADGVAVDKDTTDWGRPITSGIGDHLVVRETNNAAIAAPIFTFSWRSIPVVPRGSILSGNSRM